VTLLAVVWEGLIEARERYRSPSGSGIGASAPA